MFGFGRYFGRVEAKVLHNGVVRIFGTFGRGRRFLQRSRTGGISGAFGAAGRHVGRCVEEGEKEGRAVCAGERDRKVC